MFRAILFTITYNFLVDHVSTLRSHYDRAYVLLYEEGEGITNCSPHADLRELMLGDIIIIQCISEGKSFRDFRGDN